LAYADDIDMTARYPTALKETLLSLERAAGVMALQINEEKTKCMTTRVNKNRSKYFQVEKFNFETVQSFKYLGSLVDVNNNNSVEIRKIILLANKCFYGLKRQFRSQFVSIQNKVKLYKTLMRPVLAYGSETWVLSKSDEIILRVFERKILRAIFRPTNENGEWEQNIIMSYIHCIKKVIW
jgi:sorting nexin-29